VLDANGERVLSELLALAIALGASTISPGQTVFW
jgi:hypothetical protein